MAIFTIQAPDGRKIKVDAADEETAVRGAQEWATANPLSPPIPATRPRSEGPSIERIAEGIRLAHATGDIEMVKILGAAYRKKQAEGAAHPNTVTLDVNGRKVTVDSKFLSLAREQQDATVDEIAASIGQGAPAATALTPGPGVTLERIAEALRRADAAGNADDARALAQAYRQMQAQQGAKADAAPTLGPGATQLQGKVSELPSRRPSLGDEAMSFGRGIIEGIPIAGPMLSDWRRGLDANLAATFQGGNAGDYKAQYEAADEDLRAKTGGARTVGGLTGAVLSTAPLGGVPGVGKMLGMSGGTGSRMLFGAGSGAVISGADTLARGGSFEDAGRSALVGGALGGAFPAVTGLVGNVGQKIAQSRATSAAIANAPSAADLKTVARDLFKQVDQAGVTVDTGKFGQFVSDLANNAKKLRINPHLDTKAFAAFQELIGALGDVQRNGGKLAISDLHTLRQIAQKAATSTEGRDTMFANMIVHGLDDFITKPGVTVIPAGSGGGAAGNELLKAISTWGRAKRVSLVEDAMERAKNSASGYENGLRAEFRKLLNNDRIKRLFTATEIAEIEKVVRGSSVANLAKLFGKFGFGPGATGLGGFLGGSAGFTLGGPIGAAAFALGASGARKAGEKLTENAANRAAKVVATPNIPMLPQRQTGTSLLAPALLPLELTRKREPIEITVLGGNNSRL